MRKKQLVLTAFFLLAACIVSFFIGRATSVTQKSEIFQLVPTPIPTPLAKYTLEHLKSVPVIPAEFNRGELLKETDKTQTTLFNFTFDPTLSGEDRKTVSGVFNEPKEEGIYPLVVMFRGYVDPTIYTPGVGTKNAAEYFAQNGFITVAPDFLGYAGSSEESGNIFETRFQTYTTAITLLDSIATPQFTKLTNKWDRKNIFIWAHSNGGQVALTTLAVTEQNYPTTLWAPVTKPFPYSVLYYTDESVDGGKFIRKELSKFETLYNTDLYSFTNYLSGIKAPLQFAQGTADDAIPEEWTRAITNTLKKTNPEVTYYEYAGADHNLRPAWDIVVERDVAFFQKWMRENSSEVSF